MNIFVSHSLKDVELITNIQSTLNPYGIKLLIAEHHLEHNGTITEKIERMIHDSDFALILLTEKGAKSNFVQQEIGYISSQKKPFLQLVQLGIESTITGFNFGRDYIPFDPNCPQHALEKMKRKLLAFWEQQKRMRQAQIEEERRNNEIKIGILTLTGLLVLALANNSA